MIITDLKFCDERQVGCVYSWQIVDESIVIDNKRFVHGSMTLLPKIVVEGHEGNNHVALNLSVKIEPTDLQLISLLAKNKYITSLQGEGSVSVRKY